MQGIEEQSTNFSPTSSGDNLKPFPQSSTVGRIALKTPPPNLEEVGGRIKEGAKRADMTEKSR